MVLSAPVVMGLDDCLEYIAADELVEVRGLASHLPNRNSGRAVDRLYYGFPS